MLSKKSPQTTIRHRDLIRTLAARKREATS
jgi:hypothetical protein